MTTPSSLLVILLFILSTACSNEKAVVVEKSSQKLSEDNVFKEYESALDKAKGVEQTILDSADARKREMKEQGY
ncbi:MAG: hypothetical protein GKR92_05905 [Gammaproteobacteria bacterium]|nr:MAG: hypothetical protein GKR92_05905 [Gammaproteobacteria bacterium]